MVLFRRLLGDVLRAQRMRRGMTLREVSAEARVSLGYISEIERGQKEASSELLASLCSALDLPLSVVLREVSDLVALEESLGAATSPPERWSPAPPDWGVRCHARDDAPACSAFLDALLLPLFAVTSVSHPRRPRPQPTAHCSTPLPGYTPSDSANAAVRPTSYTAYRADLAGVRAQLAGWWHKTLSIPDPAGTATVRRSHEDSVDAAALQAEYPEIRTYAGTAADGTTIRLDVTPLGFHAMVRRADGVDVVRRPRRGPGRRGPRGQLRRRGGRGRRPGPRRAEVRALPAQATHGGRGFASRPRGRGLHPAHLPPGPHHRPDRTPTPSRPPTTTRTRTRWFSPPRPRWSTGSTRSTTTTSPTSS